MFFPHYIKVKRSDKVLDVGSGGYPYWRADVLCDKYDEGDAECKDHWGDAPIVKDRPFYRIIDGKLPFADKEFDLVTCACVLEHIETEKIPAFVKELSRVGKKVYIEVPKPFYDMTYNLNVHLSLCDIFNGMLVFIDKKDAGLETQTKFHQWMWHLRRDNIFTVDNNPSVTAVGMMFEGEIRVRILTNKNDFWLYVMLNDYFCTPPTFLWKVFNRLKRIIPKKRHKWEVPYHLRHK